MAEERRLLVAGNPADGDARAEQFALADLRRRADDLRQQPAVDAEQRQQLVVPVPRLERAEHRARGVRHVGDVARAAGEPPDEPAVDRPEGETARVVALEQPLELRRGEVRVGHESGSGPDQLPVETGAALCGSPVLPDDRPVDRSPRAPVPEQSRLALVGDADRLERV